MPRHRVPLRERSEASSFLVRTASAASIANRNSSKRRWSTADVPPLDVTSREVGDDSDAIAATPVTSAGVFVTPNVVLAALSTSEWLMCSGDRHDSLSTLQSSGAPFPCVVITAEVGGWLRVREQRNGAIRYQRRLRSLSDPSCLCWGSPSLCGGSINGGPIFFAGQQCGLVTVLQLRGETIVEVADCVLHEVPIVALTRVFVRDGASHIVSAGVAEEQNEEVLATLDAGGLLAVWDTAALHCLSTAQLRQTPARCLLSDGCVPGCVFVPGGVSTAPPPPRGDDSHCHSIDDNLSSRSGQDGAFDIVLTRCPVGAGAPWKAVVAYSGAEAAVISMV
ncbi:hypothetical protein DQ04_11171020, partial [Trypanosoma grayi]|uniref:hypothetical protein n=1 Tax=Trypanosoma grayi TaxID=71804 RepID=UPI0004F428AC